LLDSIETGRKKAFSDLKYNEKYLNIQIAPFAEGAIIISEDVTDRKQMQDLLEQVRKMEVVGTLSGGIAHEFNNLLGIILGNAELAMDDIPKHNPTHEFLLEVKRASIRGKEIVRQLLSFSHRAETEKVTIDITELISESTPYLRTSIPTSISFEQRISDDIIPVKADKSQIQQALINLCHNAVQSMEETGGTLTITVGRQRISEPRVFAGQRLEPGEYAELIIADTGQGVSENIIANIFDPFFTTKEVNKGSGMGLAVVYGIVKGHNGYIEIASTLNEGTRVFCYFPIADEEHIEG
jgi:signal transduction histidine kinase